MPIGGCYCGAIRYEADGPTFDETLCHCGDCRRAAGAPCVAWFTVASPGLRFVKGTPKRFASSPGATRSFCSECGTPLTFQRADRSHEIDVTTASLDDAAAVPPRDQTRTSGRVPWFRELNRLREYRGRRAEG